MAFNLIGLKPSDGPELDEKVVAGFSNIETLNSYLAAHPRDRNRDTDTNTGPFPAESVLFGYTDYKVEEVGHNIPVDPR